MYANTPPLRFLVMGVRYGSNLSWHSEYQAVEARTVTADVCRIGAVLIYGLRYGNNYIGTIGSNLFAHILEMVIGNAFTEILYTILQVFAAFGKFLHVFGKFGNAYRQFRSNVPQWLFLFRNRLVIWNSVHKCSPYGVSVWLLLSHRAMMHIEA